MGGLFERATNRRELLIEGGAVIGGLSGFITAAEGARAATPVASPGPAAPDLKGLVFTDPEMDAQFLRALDSIYAGGADIGECFITARSIVSRDRQSWATHWNSLGDRMIANANESLAGGHTVSARESFLRAVTYYRTSSVFLYAPPLDETMVRAYQRQRDAFQQAAALMSDWSIETVQIPYENTTLEGYLALPAGGGPFPIVVMVDGYDGTKEELYFAGGLAALRRGYAALLIDGPGQGGVLFEQGLVFRPDWEAVVTPQIDWLLARPEIDPARIVLMGRSWGGYLAPRAATAEHRIAALVADAAQYDPGGSVVGMLPEQYRALFEAGDRDAVNKILYDGMAASESLDFLLQRGMLTHGFATPYDYMHGLAPYTLVDRAGSIECPSLICRGEADPRGDSAKQLYDAIVAPKEFIDFKIDDGAGEHDEAGAAALFAQRVFDWLDRTLA